MKYFYSLVIFLLFFNGTIFAQFPGCPNVEAGPDQTLNCTTNCTNLTATPFAAGATTTYTVSSITHSPPVPYNLAGGTAVSVNIDDVWSAPIILPFNFCYFGQNYNRINVGSNGTIQFGGTIIANTGQPWSYTASCPSTALVNAGDIFGPYHDIHPGIPTPLTTIKWHILGTAPCRIFVASFYEVPMFSCTAMRATHQIVLYETTNTIDVYVEKKPLCTGWNGGRAIIGIQNPTGTAGIAAPGRNANVQWNVTTPEAWRFKPSGAPIYTVAWFQGATQIGTGNTINVCPAGTSATYTARATYTNCDGVVIIETDNVTVNFAGSLPAAAVSPASETCANQNNGSVIINNAPGAGPFTVTISGPSNTTLIESNAPAGVASFTNLPDGTYSYTSTGQHGCTNSGTFVIAAGPSCCAVTASSTPLLCNGVNIGTISATPINAIGMVSYVWSGAGSYTGQVVNNLPAGTYNLTMTDAGGCVATTSTTIVSPTPIIASSTFVNVSCFGGNNGSITVTASGGTAPLQYSLNGGAFSATSTFSTLSASANTITIRDANNCTTTINRTITQPTVLGITLVSQTSSTCAAANGTATVLVTGGSGGNILSSPGATVNNVTGVVSGLSSGSHVITVTNSNGCTQTVNVLITSQTAPILSILNNAGVTCFSANNGSVSVGATAGFGTLTYSLSPGVHVAVGNTFNDLLAGSYTATVTDENGCATTIPVVITTPTQVNFTAVGISPSCVGACDGGIAVTASGGTPNYSYSVGGPAVLENVLTPTDTLGNLCAGSFIFVVSDANGCLRNLTVNVNPPIALTATFASTAPICDGASDGTITVNAAGGSTPYQYFANTILQGSSLITGMASGGNIIRVTDAKGCIFTSTVNLVDPAPIVWVSTAVTPSNCGSADGGASVIFSGPNAGFNFDFYIVPAIIPAITNTTGTISSFSSGLYRVVATDVLGCKQEKLFGINDIQMGGTILDTTDASCFASCDGSVQAVNINGAGNINYFLFPGVIDPLGDNQTSPNGFDVTFSGLCAGNKAILLSDAGSCLYSLLFDVDQPLIVDFDTIVTNIFCSGAATGSIEIQNPTGGTGPYLYHINAGIPSAPTTFTGLSANSYPLTVTDSRGCIGLRTVTVTQNAPVDFTATISNLNCFDDSSGFVQIIPSGGAGQNQGANYTYSKDNFTTSQTSQTFFGLHAGNVTISVRDIHGCQKDNTYTLTEPVLLTISGVTSPTLCEISADGEVTMNALGGTPNYVYSVDGNIGAALIAGLTSGNHTISVTDDNNCVANGTVLVTSAPAITISAVATNETCTSSNGQIQLSAAGGTGAGYTFTSNTISTPSLITGIAAGTYALTVRDGNNCLASMSQTIINFVSPVINSLVPSSPLCNAGTDGQIIANTTAGGSATLTFSVSGTADVTSPFTGLGAGSYTITVTDANGCIDSETTILTQPLPLVLNRTSANLSCFNNATGQINMTGTGGTLPYLFSISSPVVLASSGSYTGIASGTYQLLIEDDNGCQTASTVTLTQPAILAVQSKDSVNVSCFDLCDASASIVVTGGTVGLGYEYFWSSNSIPSTIPSITGVCVGTLSVYVNDQNGCELTQFFNITQPPLLQISSVTATEPSCNGSCNGALLITASNATSFSIDNGLTFSASGSFSGLCAGTYPIVVRNAEGCLTSQSIIIDQPASLVQALIPEDGDLICYNGFGTLSASVVGGTQPYYYIWNTGDTTQYLNVNLTLPATFTCTVVDINGCISNAQNANVLIRPQFFPAVTSDTVCLGVAASFQASAIGGLPGYSYQWLNNALDTMAVGDVYTYTSLVSYSLILVARDECYQIDTLQVFAVVTNLPRPTFDVNPAIGCSPLSTVFTNTSVAVATSTFAWTFGDGTSGTNTSSENHVYTEVGCYDVSLTITSINGCQNDTTYNDVVCVVPDPIAEFSFNPSSPTNINNIVQFVNNSSGAETYSWTFENYGTSDLANPLKQFDDISPSELSICLTATSEYGCVNEICKPIVFQDEFVVFVPNSFTPDDDAFNNEFTPVMSRLVAFENYTFLIYNRWGEIIFESLDPSIGWSGIYQDKPVQQGVYIWTIKMTGKDIKGAKEFNGHVNLIR